MLTLESAQVHKFRSCKQPVIELFCDAGGYPARLAAVIFIDGKSHYTDYAPPTELLEMFKRRRDQQIMGLEILASALGLSTFAKLVKGRNVRLWSDNVGGENATRRASAKSFDHNCLVHCIWMFAAEHGLGLQVDNSVSNYSSV